MTTTLKHAALAALLAASASWNVGCKLARADDVTTITITGAQVEALAEGDLIEVAFDDGVIVKFDYSDGAFIDVNRVNFVLPNGMKMNAYEMAKECPNWNLLRRQGEVALTSDLATFTNLNEQEIALLKQFDTYSTESPTVETHYRRHGPKGLTECISDPPKPPKEIF
ncbi:MAG: hypothetical protein KC466_19755 [Myxococcales bacterium]|nr:hypothetical protein [Myxococcales bacterium]